ncbi:MAG: pseudouridine synthase [Oligoflexus sp.]
MIVYEDPYILAVNKPGGLFVHSSREARHIDDNLLLKLQNELGHKFFSVHRLDRATSGLIMLAKSSEVASQLSSLFRNRSIAKYYLAVVRGWCQQTGWINRPLSQLDRKQSDKKEALTHFYTLDQVQLDQPEQNLATTRYSLLLLRPVTGRQHQLRRHLKSIEHPIIGDTRYGKGEQNRYFRQTLGINRLLLHSFAVSFPHPFHQQMLTIEIAPEPCFHQIFSYAASQHLQQARNAISATAWQCLPPKEQINKSL